LCLAYLMALDTEDRQTLCLALYREATTMTDSIAALSLLADSSSDQREAIFAEFYKKWAGNALVVNKWLAIQVGSTRPDTLACVRKLLVHPGFDLRNPNKVYALLGSFAGNAVHFHAADGSGYALLAEHILALDPMNAQVAARMAGPFARWRRYDPARRALMQDVLTRISNTPGVSRDVFEIVIKSLKSE
ncbi:MAG: aminopeptidase N C-terminal domain-containing protein, partial [Rhodospirillaceae bacterium]